MDDFQLEPEEAVRLELTCFYIKSVLGSGRYSNSIEKLVTDLETIEKLIDGGIAFTNKLLEKVRNK